MFAVRQYLMPALQNYSTELFELFGRHFSLNVTECCLTESRNNVKVCCLNAAAGKPPAVSFEPNSESPQRASNTQSLHAKALQKLPAPADTKEGTLKNHSMRGLARSSATPVFTFTHC